MATELVTKRWCDWHLRTDGEHVEGLEYAVAFWPTDEKRDPLVVDLCPECWGTYSTAVTHLLDALGPAQVKRTPTASGQPAGKRSDSPAGSYTCPLGCGAVKIKRDLKSHLKTRHRTTMPAVAFQQGHDLDGFPITHVCKEDHPEPQGFGGGRRGIMQHRIRSHGDSAADISTDDYLA